MSTPKADNGSVSVNNGASAKKGETVTITVKPNEGYEIASVTVDGETQGAVSSYTLSYVKADHTVIATFEKKPEPTPTPTPEPTDGGIFSELDKLFEDN